MQKILPPKYYLEHFQDLIRFLQDKCAVLFTDEHHDFLRAFHALNEDAQCIYIRMLNRKGRLFDQDSLRYDEIHDFEGALAQLREHAFVEPLCGADIRDVISFLGKERLGRWLNASGNGLKRSASKTELIAAALSHQDQLSLQSLPKPDSILKQGRFGSLDYLLFLYFGQIQRSLSLYTLRDLGIRQANVERSDYQARFKTREEALSQYFYASQLESLQQDPESPASFELLNETGLAQWPPPRNAASEVLRERFLQQIAAIHEQAGRSDQALIFLRLSRLHPGPERRIRLLYAMDQKDRVREELRAVLEDPSCDEEVLFAEDFLARKFEKKKRGFLSEALAEAEEIYVDESFLGRPEEGVREYFQRRGLRSYFSENHLWTSLFGLCFWDELFEQESSAIHNPFERLPTDLVGPDFYQKNKGTIDQKLASLLDPASLLTPFLRTIALRYGRLNDIFQWHPKIGELVVDFLRHASGGGVAQVLRAMAQKFSERKSGFPDLLVLDEQGPRFVEVKAEGDQLKPRQLSQMRLLKQAGFTVEVLRVRWAVNPHQAYVVVDVETTGGSGPSHRVTEVAAVKVVNGQIVDEFQSLINPGRPIPRFITALTGINDQMVAAAPDFAQIAPTFAQFTEGAIFAAHHVRFDYGFIQSEFARLGQTYVRPLFCTCQNARKYFPKISSYGLKNLSTHFGIELENHHRALDDARAAAELLKMINQKRMRPVLLKKDDSCGVQTNTEA